MRTLEQLVRPNIWTLTPHGSMRSERGSSKVNIFLDANENPYNKPLNRYIIGKLDCAILQIRLYKNCIFLHKANHIKTGV